MYAMNDIIAMKKPHPCGGKEWRIVSVGADVKLKCLTCGRTVLLMRDELKKRAKAHTPYTPVEGGGDAVLNDGKNDEKNDGKKE